MGRKSNNSRKATLQRRVGNKVFGAISAIRSNSDNLGEDLVIGEDIGDEVDILPSLEVESAQQMQIHAWNEIIAWSNDAGRTLLSSRSFYSGKSAHTRRRNSLQQRQLQDSARKCNKIDSFLIRNVPAIDTDLEDNLVNVDSEEGSDEEENQQNKWKSSLQKLLDGRAKINQKSIDRKRSSEGRIISISPVSFNSKESTITTYG